MMAHMDRISMGDTHGVVTQNADSIAQPREDWARNCSGGSSSVPERPKWRTWII